MRVFSRCRTQAIFIACALLFSVLVCGCGILPKMNTDPAARTREVSTEQTSSVNDTSGAVDPSDPLETEEEVLSPLEQAKKDEKEYKGVFYRFFEEVYDQYIRMGEIDLSDVLDMSEPACVQFEEDLRKSIEQLKTDIQKGTASPPEKLPYQISFLKDVYSGPFQEDRWAGIYFDLIPLAERTEPKYEDYLDQYPPFMTFGRNKYYIHKVDKKWKIYSFDDPMYYGSTFTDHENEAEIVRKYYQEAWKQYTSLEYTGFEDVIDEEGPWYESAEETLKACIESWKKEMGTDPGKGMPEELSYDIHFLSSEFLVNLEDENNPKIVKFIIIPTADREEGMTDEEYLGQYPAFMRFGENWFSLQGFYDEHPFRFLIEDLNPEYEDLGPLYESAG